MSKEEIILKHNEMVFKIKDLCNRILRNMKTNTIDHNTIIQYLCAIEKVAEFYVERRKIRN